MKSLPILLLLPTLHAETIRITGPVDVAAEEISLGDIARIEPPSEALASIPLGHAPYAGHYRWISKGEVEEALRKWGGEQPVRLLMEEKVLVRRRSQRVTARQLQEAVRKHFEEQGGEAAYFVEQVEAPSDLVLPAGFLEIRIQQPSAAAALGRVSLKADLLLDGRLERSVWVRAALSAEQPVVVAVRDLPRGHRVQADDVALVHRRLERLGDYFSSPQAVVGTVLERSLRAESPIPARFVERPPAVKRGDFVTLLARGPSFQVSTTGRAKGGGAVGDMIAVENIQSKKVVRAVITGDKQVQVNLPGAQQ